MFMEGQLLNIQCMAPDQSLVWQQQQRTTHISSFLKEMDPSLVMLLSTTPTTCFTTPLVATTHITMVHQCLLHLHLSYHQVCVSFLCFPFVCKQLGNQRCWWSQQCALQFHRLDRQGSRFTSDSMMLLSFKSLRQALFTSFICMPRSSTSPVA